MGFATLTKVKLMLGIADGDTSRDAELSCIVDAVNGEMLDLFGLDQCAPKTYIDTLDIVERDDGQNWVKTPSYPIITVVGVTKTSSGQPITPSLLYTRPLGRILLTCGCFPFGRQTIEASYVAGFEEGSQALAALSNAANLAAVAQANVGLKTGFIEEKIGEYRYKIASPGSSGSGDTGYTNSQGLPLAWGRMMCRYTRPFAHTS